MPDDLGQPKLGPHGGPRARGQRNPETMPTGVRRDYILRRLERDGRHDLVEAIREGRVSAYTIACELGWTKRAEPISARTNAAKRRQHQLRVIAGELGPGAKMELIYGPSPAMGSYFDSREALQAAWAACRDELLERANPGRRPAGFYEFDWDGPRPAYAVERSTLWRMGQLTADEKILVEHEWHREFQTAQAPGFSVNAGTGEILTGDCARAAHYRHHDIPTALIKRWTAAARRHRARQSAVLEETTVAAK
jgi:hypothetical protein